MTRDSDHKPRVWVAVKDGHVVAQEATAADLFIALDRLGIKGAVSQKLRTETADNTGGAR